MDFSDLITEEIDERFCYIKYDKFNLIMMKSNGYINASKLCKLGGKRFDKWKRLDGSKKLIKEIEKLNENWKFNENPACPDLGILEIIIKIESSGKKDNKYEVSGSYVHQDLIPHICSWISEIFAIKVSKIINRFMSGKYEFKLKEKDDKIDRLQKTLDIIIEQNKNFQDQNKQFQEKYDKDTEILKDQNKQFQEKYDKDTEILKEQNKQFQEKYNQDTEILNQKIDILNDKLNHKVINSKYNRKLAYLVFMKKDDNNLECIRGQQRYTKSKIKKLLDLDYEIFYNIYEPNAISAFNKIKEDLIKEKKISINYNSIELINDYKIKEFKTLLKSLNVIRKT